MSNAVKAVVGVVLTVVGVALWETGIGPVLVNVGVSLLLNAAASLFINGHRAPPLSGGININYSGTLEPRRLIYGATRSTGSGSDDCMGQVLAAIDRGGDRSVRAT